MNATERVTTEICTRSFLQFWTFANPVREDNGEELTDVLVVSDPFIILFSVKDVDIAPTGDMETQSQRWFKRAIEKSYRQLYGAERVITNRISAVLTSDRKHAITLPDRDAARIYRVGVSIGRRPGFALPFGRFETGFVHFFDQQSFPRVLGELDTITDFVEYLEAKQGLFDGPKTARFRSEEDLLAVYLHKGRKFPFAKADIALIQPMAWDELLNKTAFQKRKEQERKSYVWDAIIAELFRDATAERLLFDPGMARVEESLRALSRETRFSRMILADWFLKFIGFYGNRDPRARARVGRAESGAVYVFLVDAHREDNRIERFAELELRCHAARNLYKDAVEVVGIARNPYQRDGGHSYDLCYINEPTLTPEESAKISEMQRETGYFLNPRFRKTHYDEYPE